MVSPKNCALAHLAGAEAWEDAGRHRLAWGNAPKVSSQGLEDSRAQQVAKIWEELSGVPECLGIFLRQTIGLRP